MSEWVDFLVYVLEAIGLWVVIPRWGTRMAWPMIRDRNPAWVDANPNVIANASPGSWFLRACYAWCGVSVAVLLVVNLGLLPQRFMPEASGTPDWKVLMATNNLLIAIGLIGYLSGVSVFLRWMHRNVPISERRQATLRPRTAGDFVPRWAIVLVHGVVAAHLLSWLYVGVSGFQHTPHFWWRFAGMAAMNGLVYILGRATVLRRPDYLDQTAAAAYRRVEVGLVLFLQLILVVFGTMALYRELYDIPVQHLGQRYGNLVFCIVFTAVLFAVNRMPFRPASKGSQPPLAARHSL